MTAEMAIRVLLTSTTVPQTSSKDVHHFRPDGLFKMIERVMGTETQ